MPTLHQIEVEVARRTGPFFQAAQAPGEPTSSTATSALMPALQTNALLGGPENLWLVRRGVLADGTPTPAPINPQDRERMVQTFDAGAGRVIVDRNWQQPMYPSELADFFHLHPVPGAPPRGPGWPQTVLLRGHHQRHRHGRLHRHRSDVHRAVDHRSQPGAARAVGLPAARLQRAVPGGHAPWARHADGARLTPVAG